MKKYRKSKQLAFIKRDWMHEFNHGGKLRNQRSGRRVRPLACKESLHVVFKINKDALKQLSLRSIQTQRLVNSLILKYSKKFFIKIEQISIQNDHIHLLIRTSKRSLFHYFFRVVAGQMAQQLKKEGLISKTNVTDTQKNPLRKLKLWKYRPFTRIVKSYKAYKVVKDYIQLNIKEAQGLIKYQKMRLKGLSMSEWSILWS